MLSLVPFLLTLDARVEVEAGFYSLADLSLKLAKQGVPLDVRPDCAEEQYAVRFRNATPEAVLNALRQTTRLDIERVGQTWRVTRSVADQDNDRNILGRFFNACLTEPAVEKTRIAAKAAEMLAMNFDEREAELATLRQLVASGTINQDFVNDVYLCTSAREMPFSAISLPAATAQMGRAALERYTEFHVSRQRSLFIPTGQKEQLFPFTESRNNPGMVDRAAVRLAWHPVLGGVGCRIIYTYEGGLYDRFLQFPCDLRRSEYGPPSPESVLPTMMLRDYRTRIAKSEPILASLKHASNPVEGLNQKALTPTEMVLEACEQGDQDLLFYASPLSDRVLNGQSGATLRSIFGQTNTGEFDPISDRSSLKERTGRYMRECPPKKNWPSLSLVMVDKVLIVRNELDFLDGLVEGPTVIGAKIENAWRKGNSPTYTEVAKAIAELTPRSWKGTTFSERFLRFTNPVTFHPFAKAMVASPAFAKIVNSLGADQKIEIPWDKVDAAARREFETVLLRVAMKSDAVNQGFTMDPLEVEDILRDRRMGNGPLRLERKGPRLELTFVFGNTKLWSAWLENAVPEKP